MLKRKHFNLGYLNVGKWFKLHIYLYVFHQIDNTLRDIDRVVGVDTKTSSDSSQNTFKDSSSGDKSTRLSLG